MEDKYIRYIDIDDDGNPHPLAASNLKKSGRIVIGLEGVHTLDDADVLLKAAEADKMNNWDTLYNTLRNETSVNEFVMLSGTYYISGYADYGQFYDLIPDGKTLCGSGNTIIELDGRWSDNGDTIIGMGMNSKISDLQINFYPQSFSERIIYATDNSTIDNVTIFAKYNNYISETNPDYAPIGIQSVGQSIEILNCIIENCSTGIILDKGGATIRGCSIRSCGTGIYSYGGAQSTIENNTIEFSSGIHIGEPEKYPFSEGDGIYVRDAIRWSIIGNTFCYYGEYPDGRSIAINMTYQYDTRIEKNRFDHFGKSLLAIPSYDGSIFVRDNVDVNGNCDLYFGDIGSTFSSGNEEVSEDKFKQLNEIGHTYTASACESAGCVGWDISNIPEGLYFCSFGYQGDYGKFIFYHRGGWYYNGDCVSVTQGDLIGTQLSPMDDVLGIGYTSEWDLEGLSDMQLTRIL